MNKTISLVILAAGILLTIFGLAASGSFSSEVSQFFTGAPTNKAIWMLVGGVLVAVLGMAGLWWGSKAS